MKKLFLFLLVIVFFSGCSGNLLKGIDSSGGGTAQKVADAQAALDEGDYAAAQAAVASEVATYSSSTGTLAAVTNPEAEIVYGQALLGQQGVDAPTIFENALSKIDSCSGSNQTQCNFDIIKDLVPNASQTTLTEATARLNNSVTTSADSSSSGVQLTTAVANGITAAVTILDKFDNNKDGYLDSTYTSATDVDTAVDTAWKEISNSVVLNAENSVTYVNAMISSTGTNTANDDLKKALTDAKTEIDKYNAKSSVSATDIKNLLGLK